MKSEDIYRKFANEFRYAWLLDNLHAIPEYDYDLGVLLVRPFNDVATVSGGYTIKCTNTIYIPFYYRNIQVGIKSLTHKVQL